MHEITYLLTPRSRERLENLTGLQLVKKFPRISRNPKVHYRTQKLRQLSLSWASPIQSTYPHPTSWRSILILSTHLRLGLPSGLFPSGFHTKNLYTPPLLTQAYKIQKPENYAEENIQQGMYIFIVSSVRATCVACFLQQWWNVQGLQFLLLGKNNVLTRTDHF